MPENTTLHKDWKDYFTVLRRLGVELEKLSVLQQEKNRAVSVGDILVVDEIMKQEQALSLSLRGLEQKRVAGLINLKIKSQRLVELADFAPEPLKLEAKATGEELRRQYTLYSVAAQAAKTTLELNLHQIELAQGGQINYTSVGTTEHSEGQRRTDYRV